MNIDEEISKSLEYINYNINQMCEIHLNIYNKGTFGVGKIIKESDNFIITKQYNCKFYTKEEYFKNKEHSKKVYSGLY